MVINLLGKAGEKIESRESSMLKYDRTEFYFYHHESGLKYLNGIVIQPIPISADKGNLRMNYYWLNKKLKYHSAKNQLELENINFIEITEALSAARNSTIQGTQADFVKEASVKLQYYYWKNKIDADILSWVHDEIVDRVAENIAEEVSKIKHKIMVEVANKYLHNVEIDCEMTILPHWTK